MAWLGWVVIEPVDKEILSNNISKERNMFVAEHFLSNLVYEYGEHPISIKDGRNWYPQSCQFLKLNHHLQSSYEKSIIEWTMQYIKDRIENFDDYFPCKKEKCELNHVKQWLNLFIDQHNGKILS